MTPLHDLIQAYPQSSLALGGLGLGFLLGTLLQVTNFCAMGGVSDWQSFGDTRRLRAWFFAGAVAIAGAAALDAAGIIDLQRSMYLAPRLNWSGHILGGLMFGAGMIFAGGCASRNLVRAGAGDLRALMTLLVLGLFAYIAIGGVLGPARAALETATAIPLPAPSQGLGDLFAAVSGVERSVSRTLMAMAAAGSIALWCLASRPFRSSRMHLLSGIGVGLAVTAGWAMNGFAYDEMSAKPLALVSLSFIKPTGDTLDWIMRSTALGLPGFGAAAVIGVFLGSLASALASGRFRFATFHDTADTLRTLGGAALMGTGGVLALGCSIGQGVTGISTLALGSFLALAAIIAGAVLALKALERWST